MKALLFGISIFALNSFTIYTPILMGTGQYSGKHVQDCSNHILWMTAYAANSRLDFVLNKFQLTCPVGVDNFIRPFGPNS